MDKAGTSPEKSAWQSRWPSALALLGLGLGVLTERLFFGRPLGVSYPIWLTVCCLALLAWSLYERREPSKWALILLLPTVATAALVPLRVEPLTTFLSVSVSLGLLAVLVRLFRSGRFFDWGWLDILVAEVWVPLEAWARPWPTLSVAQSKLASGDRGRKRFLAITRGLLLALPVIAVFTILLSAADFVFGDWVEEALAWLNIEKLIEVFFRSVFALLSAVFLLGGLVVALRRSEDDPLVREGSPLLPRFLGLTEALIILGGVDALFLFFVAIQFHYFFGGETNISAAGYTYAEYARNGFGELVFAGFLSLGLILALASWVKQDGTGSRRAFNGFSLGLVAMNGVMLLSAFQRLQLYERAFGFTRLRTYTHVAIFWLGILFVAFVGLLLGRRLRAFAPTSVLVAVGFSLTLGLLNVDAFIVRRNFEHLEQIGELDAYYLTTLSEDAVPEIVRHLDRVPDEERARVLAGLSCRSSQLERRVDRGWPSFRLPLTQAWNALSSISNTLAQYPILEEGDYFGSIKTGEDEYHYCSYYYF